MGYILLTQLLGQQVYRAEIANITDIANIANIVNIADIVNIAKEAGRQNI